MNRLVCMTGSAADRGAADLYRQQAPLFAERFPRRFLTRLEELAKDCETYGKLFTDVLNPSHPYYKAIYWAAQKGITKGYSDGSFGIDLPCTRGHAVMFLWRVAGCPAPKAVSKSPFSDVPKTHTFYKAVSWAASYKITTGFSDGTFRPSAECTRGQCVAFIYRMLNL